jgi:hypothetical protein
VALLAWQPSGAVSGLFLAGNSSSNDIINISDCTAGVMGWQQLEDHQQQQTPQQTPSPGRTPVLCLGLQGKQVLGVHSCYRDPDWALLQLSLIRYCEGSNGSCSSSTALASGNSIYQQALLHGQQQCGQSLKQTLQQQQQPSEQTEAEQQQQQRQDDEGALGEGNPDEVAAETVAWVQRTGGDLAMLEPADMDDEDTGQQLVLKAAQTFLHQIFLCSKHSKVDACLDGLLLLLLLLLLLWHMSCEENCRCLSCALPACRHCGRYSLDVEPACQWEDGFDLNYMLACSTM